MFSFDWLTSMHGEAGDCYNGTNLQFYVIYLTADYARGGCFVLIAIRYTLHILIWLPAMLGNSIVCARRTSYISINSRDVQGGRRLFQFTNLHVIRIYFTVCDARVGRRLFQSQETISYRLTVDYHLCTRKQTYICHKTILLFFICQAPIIVEAWGFIKK